jgi:DUF1365 family protein
MKNAIYEGNILHSRLAPKKHKFNYKICYFFFDLDNPKGLISIPLLLSFNPKNYLSSDQIRNEISREFGSSATSTVKSIYILTQLSYFGFCFNPVSFYYCYGENDKLLYVVSQITNTPWGEKNINCFDFQKTHGQMHFDKDFHVSPFMPMEINYFWKFNNPQEIIDILMTSKHQDEKNTFFFAHMNLASKDLNRKNVLLTFIRYPFMSFITVAGIYWHALILYLKQVPFYTHPKKKEAL